MIQKEGTWANYLKVLENEKKDWTDPTYLMQAFGITQKAAQQIIDRRKAEIDDAAELELAKQEWEELE